MVWFQTCLFETRLLKKMLIYFLKSNFTLEVFISEANISIEPKCVFWSYILAEQTVVIDSSQQKKFFFFLVAILLLPQSISLVLLEPVNQHKCLRFCQWSVYTVFKDVVNNFSFWLLENAKTAEYLR